MCKQCRQRHIITAVVTIQKCTLHSSHTTNQLNHSEMKVLQSTPKDGYTYSLYIDIYISLNYGICLSMKQHTYANGHWVACNSVENA